VDAFAGQQFDDRLPDLTQTDAVLRQLREIRRDAEDVSLQGVAVKSKKEIGR
jgi:hypothetical protein